MTDEPIIPEVLDPLPSLTPKQMEVVVLRAQGMTYEDIEELHGFPMSTACRWMRIPAARQKMAELRRSVIELLEDAAPVFVDALTSIADDEMIQSKDRVGAARSGLQALAALKRADAASRVADVEENRALSPDELAQARSRILERVKLRLVGE